mgnify:FL=1
MSLLQYGIYYILAVFVTSFLFGYSFQLTKSKDTLERMVNIIVCVISLNILMFIHIFFLYILMAS